MRARSSTQTGTRILGIKPHQTTTSRYPGRSFAGAYFSLPRRLLITGPLQVSAFNGENQPLQTDAVPNVLLMLNRGAAAAVSSTPSL